MSLRVINVKFYPPYSSSDEGSGRARVSMATAQKHFPQARLNSIVKLRLHFPTYHDDTEKETTIILCSIWPDSERVLGVDQICVDDSVHCVANNSSVAICWPAEDWMEAKAEVRGQIYLYRVILFPVFKCFCG